MITLFRKCPCCREPLNITFLIHTTKKNSKSHFFCNKCHSSINKHKKLIFLISLGIGMSIGKLVDYIVLFIFGSNGEVSILEEIFVILILVPIIWVVTLYYLLPLNCDVSNSEKHTKQI